MRVGRLQPEEYVAFLHLLRIIDQDLPDDATFEMLDRLVVALDGDLALRNGGAIKRRERGPYTEGAEHQRDGGKAKASIGTVIIDTDRNG